MLDFEEEEGYKTLNSLNRSALFFGVPLIFFIFNLACFLVLTFVFYVLLDWGIFGLVLAPAIFGGIHATVTIMCENDPNGLHSVFRKISSFILVINKGNKGVLFFSSKGEKPLNSFQKLKYSVANLFQSTKGINSNVQQIRKNKNQ